MRMVDLAPGVQASRLGYGCAGLMGRTGRRDSLRLLEYAFEAGITHFDVAPSYGYGEAETVVGQFLRGRRGEVTVATKLGIEPPAGQAALRAAKAVARGLTAIHPRLRAAIRRPAASLAGAHRFDAPNARASLERSVRRLATDHVDLLLLHDASPDDMSDDLHDFMAECLVSGKARAVGVASSSAEAAQIVRADELYAAVVQVPDDISHRQLPGQAVPGARAIITHSILAAVVPTLGEVIYPAEGRWAWSTALGGEPTSEEIARLALATGLRRNPQGVVLMSSRSVPHLRANCSVVSDPPGPRSLEAFERLLTRHRDPASDVSATASTDL